MLPLAWTQLNLKATAKCWNVQRHSSLRSLLLTITVFMLPAVSSCMPPISKHKHKRLPCWCQMTLQMTDWQTVVFVCFILFFVQCNGFSKTLNRYYYLNRNGIRLLTCLMCVCVCVSTLIKWVNIMRNHIAFILWNKCFWCTMKNIL